MVAMKSFFISLHARLEREEGQALVEYALILGLISVVAQVVKEVATVPIWCKLTPSTTDIAAEARASFAGGADAIVSSNTFPSLPQARAWGRRTVTITLH